MRKNDQSTSPAAHTNRLAGEKSPYLLQHAHNPVDWFRWGEEAFAKARKENKPIFLSVGYSTCHWCHVMERESFENPAIATLLNDSFVSIKVDREERPDVDAVYMTYVQATTGSGGWPMSVWLTPSLKPVFGGTYFPPDEWGGRPGFATVLNQIAEAWKADPARLEGIGDSSILQLQKAAARSQAGEAADPAILSNAYQRIRVSYDPVNGGFGGAPKFPRPATLHFLFRYAARTATRDALDMALNTLRKMAEGGIHDALGGGFHRYSTDGRWHVPHFEKMLYDQAQLASAALDAYQITHDPFYAGMARDVLDYVRRDMTGGEGQFYSAEDADSESAGHPGVLAEGAFYVWSQDELRKALGEKESAIFDFYYGVKAGGNAEGPGAGELRGKNVLIVSHTVPETAKAFQSNPEQITLLLESCRGKLLKVRAGRLRPRLDDKAVTAWNGLMLSAFARGYQALGDAAYLESAERAATFIRKRLARERGDLLWRRFRAGEAAVEGCASDYAFLIQGLLDLYETTFDIGTLSWALALQERQNTLFWDLKAGGYFDAGSDPRILLRMKEAYDGAEPSANSVSALNLLRLHHVAPDAGYEATATALFKAFGRTLRDAPDSAPQLAAALGFRLEGTRQVVIAGRKDSPDTRLLLNTLHAAYLPDATVLLADGGAGQKELGKRLVFIRDVTMIDGKATAYVCQNFVCRLPTTEAKVMMEQLQERRRPLREGGL
jgi:uncharacterized protein YyaL (SSP411 family)